MRSLKQGFLDAWPTQTSFDWSWLDIVFYANYIMYSEICNCRKFNKLSSQLHILLSHLIPTQTQNTDYSGQREIAQTFNVLRV